MTIRAKISERLAFLIFFPAAIFTLFYAREIYLGGEQWKTADWLINYDSGFIRRGLAGSLILSLTSDFRIILWVTFFIQVSLYMILFINVVRIYRVRNLANHWLLILYSPAFLLFPFYDFQGGFRKEIIGFMIFSYLCLKFTQNKIKTRHLMIVSAFLLIAFFSHEINCLVVVFFIYLLLIAYQNDILSIYQAKLFTFIWSLLSLLALFLSMRFPGSQLQADAICKTIDKSADLCGGAINALSGNLNSSVNWVLDRHSSDFVFAPILFIVALTPLFPTNFFNKQRLALILLGVLSVLPLFAFAIDWGRWVHILVTYIFCLAITEKISLNRFNFFEKRYLGFFYLFCWSITHGGDFRFGLWSLLQFLFNRFGKFIS